jgi:hypothetical protein
MADTATTQRQLTPPERAKLKELASLAGVELVKPGAATARTKVSEGLSRYQALTNVSVPQRTKAGTLTGQNDLITPGETCMLTEEEARSLMRTDVRSGRRTPAIRPFSEASDPVPRIHPKQFSGQLRQPPPPQQGTEDARPDPPGSSHVLRMMPEENEPQPGGEETGGDPDALDIPPSGAAAAGLVRA